MVFINELVSAIILAVIQGAIEWFPVSSSGHLVIFEKILGYSGGLVFEVALHFGTLMAVFVYFGKDITEIIKDLLSLRLNTEHGKMGLLLIVATIPAAVVGFLVIKLFETVFASLSIIAIGWGITGLFLFLASLDFNKKNKIDNIKKLKYSNAFLIGMAQMVAIVPGISRSGATIGSGVLFGLSEKAAMKFSYILSIPVILGANILAIGNQRLPTELIWATLVSFAFGLVFIHVAFNYVLIKKKNFRWFAAYCLLLALGTGAWVIFG